MNNPEHADASYSDLVVIGQEEFRKRWDLLQTVPIKPSYLQRAEQLSNDYVCFRFKPPQHTTRSHPKGHKTDVNSSLVQEYPSVKNMRPRIGPLFTNTEGKARKNFVSFMNKLSPQNKDDILQNFIRSLDPDNIDIYMDQIIKLFQVQPTYHDMYMEVMQNIIAIAPDKARAFIENHFLQFLRQQQYLIPNSILECVENIDPNGENSDNLCEYTKWKKEMKALIILYIHMLAIKMFGTNKDIEKLFTTLAKTCDTHWNTAPIVDIYLDITLHAVKAIYKYIPKGLEIFPNLATKYKNWNNTKDVLSPASRFKVLDIIEIMNKKTKK